MLPITTNANGQAFLMVFPGNRPY